jgi:Dockerin type I domain/PEP-CTERM motif
VGVAEKNLPTVEGFSVRGGYRVMVNPRVSHFWELMMMLRKSIVGVAAMLVGLAAGSSRATLTYEFTPNFYQFGASGPASGRLVIAGGIGGGDTFVKADVVSFELSHTFDATTTIDFSTADGDPIGVGIGGLYQLPTLSSDALTISSGYFTATDTATGAYFRMSFNSGDTNDNFLVDSAVAVDDGAYGGAFGGWDLLVGDITGDGAVNLSDLNEVKNNFGSDGAGGGDTNGDGVVNLTDLNNVKNNFGNGSPGFSVVPEPGTVMLLAMGCAVLARRRRAVN